MRKRNKKLKEKLKSERGKEERGLYGNGFAPCHEHQQGV